QGYNRIPLHREILADLDTPLSVYLKFAHAPYSYLFESVQGGEKWGRYSIIGLPCKDQYEVYGHRINHIRQGHLVSSDEYEDPLEFIDQLQARFKVPKLEHLPLFTGGLVGYFAYDTVRYIEPRLGDCPNPDEINTPDILLMLSEEVVVFDNLSGTLHIVVHVDPSQADALELGMQRLDHLEQKLARTIPEYLKNADSNQALLEDDFISGFTEDGFKQAVEKARKYIIEGDIMQVVLSQRLTVDYHGEALDLYRALRRLNPSPYMFFLNLGGFHVVGSSPEILVRMEDHKVTVRPIAGTRPRGKTVDEDLALEADLLADPKELAEHLMLIDLGRNDVGRVAHVGSVKLTDKMIIERYSHVMHIVSNVIGQVDEGTSPMDILRATFPAGTVSGAAKVRAMEIIDELEPVKRGIYAGAVGYIGWHGNIDTAIAIRTAVIKDQKLYLQAGAGVVYDSIPENEWLETMNKGRAVMKAAVMASKSDSDKVHR
ncbi:MAG: anthranilate synthase component I, partial [Gammaproteobacteria bacterium]|nr:anthranilate synthase component I [Gammaproteobacteria bacterium]